MTELDSDIIILIGIDLRVEIKRLCTSVKCGAALPCVVHTLIMGGINPNSDSGGILWRHQK